MDEVVEALEKYKGLVPLVYDIETMSLDEARSEDMQYAVYLKREADKVIAEMEEKHKTEVKELLCLIRDKENNFNRAFDSEEKEIRRQKYKRCLAMAKWCENAILGWMGYKESFSSHQRYIKVMLFTKWHKRWLAIAEKFKPNSTALSGKGNKMDEVEANEISMSKLRAVPRSSSGVICELACERRDISNNLAKLNRAIEAAPEAVSEHHKELWRKQSKAMQEYVDVLGERIKDLIDNG